MKSLRVIFAAAICAALSLPCLGASRKPVVAAYLYPQQGALTPGDIDARNLTRINYAFASIQDGRVVLGSPQDAANLALLTGLRSENPGLTVLLSVGGWSGSGPFSDAALTEQSRQILIESAMELVDRYGLDGLDVDWEYPGQPGAGNRHRAEDKQNFTLLLKGLRARFDRATEKTHRKLYLTIAAEAADEYLQNTEMEKVQRYVDDVNLMAYDFYVPGPDHITGNIAPLFVSPRDPKQVSANRSVLAMEKAGVPAAKIVLGVPFYGHVWREVPDRDHGLFQPGKPGQPSDVPYSTIVQTMLGHGFERFWDAQASVPYLYSAEQHVFVSYEDEESLAAKCRYATGQGLGGMMFWRYFDDSSSRLLRVMDEGLRTKASGSSAKQ